MNPIERINVLADKIPAVALEAINNRISDWIASGGKETDSYIHQQLRYAENIVAQQEAK